MEEEEQGEDPEAEADEELLNTLQTLDEQKAAADQLQQLQRSKVKKPEQKIRVA
jgi:hypothetical protein